MLDIRPYQCLIAATVFIRTFKKSGLRTLISSDWEGFHIQQIEIKSFKEKKKSIAIVHNKILKTKLTYTHGAAFALFHFVFKILVIIPAYQGIAIFSFTGYS